MCLDQFSREQIPPQERFEWQPAELIAVLGQHRGRPWYKDSYRQVIAVEGLGYREVSQVAFLAENLFVVSASHEAVRIWDAKTLRELYCLDHVAEGAPYRAN